MPLVPVVDGARWRWDSVADRGDEAAPAGGVFVPLESTPAYWGQLLRALLADPTAYDVVSFDDERQAPRGLAELAPAW